MTNLENCKDSVAKLLKSKLPETYLSGQGGSNTKPRQSLENASDIVVHKFSEAHQAH
jgi:hypothetical protein